MQLAAARAVVRITAHEVENGLRRALARMPREAIEPASACRLCGIPRTTNEARTYGTLCEDCWSGAHLPSFLNPWQHDAVRSARWRVHPRARRHAATRTA